MNLHFPGGVPLKQQPDFIASGLWLCFRAVPALIGTGLFLLLLDISTASAQSPTAASEEPLAGHLQLYARGATDFTPAIMHAGKVHFAITGMIAVVTLEQSFSNSSSEWAEGIYAFPLHETAAVRRLEMQVGERLIVAEIKEKQLARQLYHEAKRAGKKASLVAQQRPNLFTNHIANIGPGETITVRLEYIQQADYSAGSFSLRFPMTITPRYMPGTPLSAGAAMDTEPTLAMDSYRGWASPTDQVPDADAISPRLLPQQGSDARPHNPITITAELDAGMPLARVDARYHEVALTRDKQQYRLSLVHGQSEMDRDFVLTWVPVTGAAPSAALFTEQVAGEYYGLLMMLPPELPATVIPPRELVFVIDTSGSMGGVAIAQAKSSLSVALRQLKPGDYFNIIEFNSMDRALHSQSVPASAHHVQRALEFVRQLQAGGGTEMLPALERALAQGELAMEEPAPERLRQIIFITDGAVGNEAELFKTIVAKLGGNRLFTVGIGSAPNSWFMRKAAEVGRGTHTHIGKLEEVGEQMDALFEYLAAPVVTDLEALWPGSVEAWPATLPDLYRGQPVVQSIRLGPEPPAGVVVVSGTLAGQHWNRQLRIDPVPDSQTHLSTSTVTPAATQATAAIAPHNGVASMWARRKISSLLDQRVHGISEPSVRAAVLPVALTHQLLSPYTSFVAIEQRITRPTDALSGARAVPNSAPRGQAPQSYAYPNTATTGPAKAFLGALFLFCALIVHVIRQPELDHVATKAE